LPARGKVIPEQGEMSPSVQKKKKRKCRALPKKREKGGVFDKTFLRPFAPKRGWSFLARGRGEKKRKKAVFPVGEERVDIPFLHFLEKKRPCV